MLAARIFRADTRDRVFRDVEGQRVCHAERLPQNGRFEFVSDRTVSVWRRPSAGRRALHDRRRRSVHVRRRLLHATFDVKRRRRTADRQFGPRPSQPGGTRGELARSAVVHRVRAD